MVSWRGRVVGWLIGVTGAFLGVGRFGVLVDVSDVVV